MEEKGNIEEKKEDTIRGKKGGKYQN